MKTDGGRHRYSARLLSRRGPADERNMNNTDGITRVPDPPLLTVNWTPVAVAPPPPVRAESRRPRLREVDCDGPETPWGRGPGGNFARPGPGPPSEPTATVRRKLREACALRLLRRRNPTRPDGAGRASGRSRCRRARTRPRRRTPATSGRDRRGRRWSSAARTGTRARRRRPTT